MWVVSRVGGFQGVQIQSIDFYRNMCEVTIGLDHGEQGRAGFLLGSFSVRCAELLVMSWVGGSETFRAQTPETGVL